MKALLVTIALALPQVALADYSLPWQLRPATIDNLVRVDSAAAVFNDDNGNVDIAASTALAASYQLNEHWAPTLRLGFIGNNAPGAVNDETAFVDPAIGMTYAQRSGDYRLALSWTTTVPIGMARSRTNIAAMTSRPAMFEGDSTTETLGVDLAYVHRGFTVQGEAMVMQGLSDSFETRAVVGAHAGYFIGSHVSLGTDLRYQRSLANGDPMHADTFTVSAGVRAHVRIKQAAIHPGVSMTRGLDARGLDAPLITAETTAIQIDVPVVF